MKKIDNITLEKGVEHIEYEIDMFRATYNVLLKPYDHDKMPLINNALVESFAIHIRNLYEFFYNDVGDSKKDTILATHYLDDPRAYRQKRTPKEEISFVQKKANKEIAHLTYERTKIDAIDKRWPTSLLVEKLEKTISAFLDELAPEKKRLFKY